ncbi:ankyrin repeat protein [Granulicella aggregans]|uniref:Ankyrin repeat protein n=1 Tax=Granulicella aggregans TaxID=474949 RepID=A0A7W7ZJ34_9BACT|nr:ankyrin repeat domain-containing protein [Granulicella aggregans]MBB5060846.1 ankyrin repeat protein [Granulicella aggregans]
MASHALHHAVKNGDLRGVSELLKDPSLATGINEADNEGWTPLMYAVAYPEADVELLRTLIRHGATIDQTSVSYALSDLQKLTELIDGGANIRYKKEHGYDALINAAYGDDVLNNPQLLDILNLLIANGVSLTGMTSYGESCVRVLSRIGRFDAVRLLLRAGANPEDVKLTPLIEAVAFGTLTDIEALVQSGMALETRDHWERTPWLFAIQTGDIGKAQFLLEHGVDKNARGRCGKPPMFYAIENGHAPMVKWLLEIGIDIEQADDFGNTALRFAVEHCNEEIVSILVNAGANVDRQIKTGTALGDASTRNIVMKLLEAGADPKELSSDGRRAILGFSTDTEMELLKPSQSDLDSYRFRCFGKHNPEVMNNSFWEGMIRSGASAHEAREALGIEEKFYGRYTEVWCAQRFGQSLTFLPDGRILQIAGEHEDHYDPDFCIYNDVFVHSPDGSIVIYGYPDSVFPPTDFHTATAVGDAIYLIGSLGYPAARRHGLTPVYRLDTTTFEMEPLQTTGECPGWIYRHRAIASPTGAIRVSGGEILSIQGGEEAHSHNAKVFVLDVERKVWSVE